jgi:hypothetical protein
MVRMRRLLGTLNYANVAATLALFISLGGASYAAIALPANSVGASQLRSGSVTPRSLAFPLAVRGITDEKAQGLAKGQCNSPSRPGEAKNVLCPAPARRGIRTPGREVGLTLRTPGELLASAVVGLRDDAQPNTTATVQLHVILDGESAASSSVVLAGGQHTQVPIQLLRRMSSGHHTVGIEVGASYSSYEPGEVVVSPVSLLASALPVAR